MATEGQKTISCSDCKATPCGYGYPKGIPKWCEARCYQDILDETKTKYLEPEDLSIHVATATVLKKGDGLWTRVQETIEFAKELAVKKIGFAICLGLLREGKELIYYFQQAGFNDMVAVGCMIGGLKDTDTGVPKECGFRYGATCNPIAQAEILNKEGTELNVVVGLCIGHDTLFLKYTKAPVTVFAVKDRVTCNNPTPVLFSLSHRRQLNQAYNKG